MSEQVGTSFLYSDSCLSLAKLSICFDPSNPSLSPKRFGSGRIWCLFGCRKTSVSGQCNSFSYPTNITVYYSAGALTLLALYLIFVSQVLTVHGGITTLKRITIYLRPPPTSHMLSLKNYHYKSVTDSPSSPFLLTSDRPIPALLHSYVPWVVLCDQLLQLYKPAWNVAWQGPDSLS